MLHQRSQIVNQGSKIVVCARVGGANTTPLFLGGAFRKAKYEIRRRRKRGRGGNSFPPTPFPSRPARAFSLAREARRQFRSKKVRISSNKRKVKLKIDRSNFKIFGREKRKQEGTRSLSAVALAKVEVPPWAFFIKLKFMLE